MSRQTWWKAALFFVVAAASGCAGLSTEEAEQRCEQLQEANPVCVTDAAYAECVTCYEECGDDCTPSASCPQTFTCFE